MESLQAGIWIKFALNFESEIYLVMIQNILKKWDPESLNKVRFIE